MAIFRRKWQPREIRMVVLLAIVLAVFAYLKRPWFYGLTAESEHYICYSTATPEQTQQILDVAEALYLAYTAEFADLPDLSTDHPKLKLKLYKNREEFKSYNPLSGWAEAYYLEPYCHQYYSQGEPNPYHWMVHEATHQLNEEVAHLDLPRWLNEGIAEYFGTSTWRNGRLHLGEVDRNTYPIWWRGDMVFTGDIEADIGAERFVPLETLIKGRGGPDIDEHFNLYYMQWWSLIHFIYHYDDGRYRPGIKPLLLEHGTLEAFKSHVGAIEEIQPLWYEYLRGVEYMDISNASTQSVGSD